VVALLNEYFDQMVEVVFRHGGVLDKFIGDALMACGGLRSANRTTRATPSAPPRNAGRLALAHAVRRDRGAEPSRSGGPGERPLRGGPWGAPPMEYTVIGDAVNLASRLAALAPRASDL